MTAHRARVDEGFSLAELLVVIVVLGIMSAIVVFAVRGVSDQSESASCVADREIVSKAEDAYRISNPQYGTEAQLVAAGLLRRASSMHDVTLSADVYEVTATSECEGVAGEPAPVIPIYVLAISGVPASVGAGVVIAPAITASVQDLAGTTLTSSTAPVTITLAASAGAVLSGTTTVNAVAGVATFSDLSIDRAGSAFTFGLATPRAATITSAEFGVTAGIAAKLTIMQQPSSGIAASAWPVQPVVAIQDAMGNTITTSTASVALAIVAGTGTAGAVLVCAPRAAVAGVATFAACAVNLAGTGYRLSATSAGLTPAEGVAFDVSGAATKLAFSQQPTSVVAGVAIAPAITVTVQDALGRTVTASPATISLTISTNPGSSTLSGYVPLKVVNGVATFSTVSLNKVGVSYRLTATSTALTSIISSTFNVTIGLPAKLAFTTQPAGAKANVSFTTQPKVTVQDAAGNTITTSTASVTLTLTGTGTAGAVLTCTANPKAAIAGLVTFSGCKINAAGSGYTLTVSAAGLASAVSVAFASPLGAASKVVFTQQPASVVAGVEMASTIKVAVQDAGGNTITASTATITLTTTPVTPVSGTISVAAVDGVATFSGLSINTARSGYKFVAASPALSSATSGSFNVTAGPVVKLAFTTQPGGGAATATWATQPKVTLQDAFGNTASASKSVALAVTSGTGTAGSVLFCTTNPRSTSSSVATYAGCKLSLAGTDYTVTATVAGLTSAISNPFNVT